MKSKSIEIAKWFRESFETIDIDWPRVQRQVGTDQLEWLLKQDKTRCQLMVENRQDDSHQYLIAEFYDDRLATEYYLLWAK